MQSLHLQAWLHLARGLTAYSQHSLHYALTVSPVQAKKSAQSQKEAELGRKLTPKERMAVDAPVSSQAEPLSSTESRSEPEIQEVSEVVNNRMLRRIIAFCGVPTFTGFCLFPFFYYLKVVQKLEVPMIAVYAVQSLTFGGALFGITYGIFSASWDPRTEGSLLGVEQFKQNAGSAIQGVLNRRKS